ncbi:hypothetical protein [Nitrolancea hollandica]|uniref:Asl1-like glycosyl hydrolase catalytic domain-containing protein n=1 Tax=Nitrolancea hollandica Lb TaxID=1129897 RepID=I4EL45_9BACT|nr:hypothetical protein [Nitrolancea hollandica]CCF85407.1 exported hypothetical protein [Nitrolancea hollandica Lb]
MRSLLISLLAFLLASSPLLASAAPIGADMIAPASANWSQHLEVFKTMGATSARYRLDPRFAPRPQEQLPQLIAAGATTIVLQIRACPNAAEIRADLTPALPVVERYRNVTWLVEVGNEPDIEGCNAGQVKRNLLDIRKQTQDLNRPGMRWIVSLPTIVAYNQYLLNDGQIEAAYDGLALHRYGSFSLDEQNDIGRAYDWVLANTRKPIWVTEVGIHSGELSKVERAERIVDWASRLPAKVQAVIVFAVTDTFDQRWPTYVVDLEFAKAFAQAQTPKGCRYFPETRFYLCHGFRTYWEKHGGLAMFGYPITPEYSENGYVVQWFERQRFEYHPENKPPYDILLGRLGAEILKWDRRGS